MAYFSDDRFCSRSFRRHNTGERNGDLFRTVGCRTSLLPLDGVDTEARCTAGIPVIAGAFLNTHTLLRERVVFARSTYVGSIVVSSGDHAVAFEIFPSS